MFLIQEFDIRSPEPRESVLLFCNSERKVQIPRGRFQVQDKTHNIIITPCPALELKGNTSSH